MSGELLKTSKEWKTLLFPVSEIWDYDGWDRSNLEHSFEQELITSKEFVYRMQLSTCRWNREELEKIENMVD